MKIYFSAAIYQISRLGLFYQEIIDTLSKENHQITQDTTLVSLSDAINKTSEQREEYYQKVVTWISESDAVALEISFPSTLHIGHELSLALEMGKPVLAFYREDLEPSFLLGKKDERILWVPYNKSNLSRRVKTAADLLDRWFEIRLMLSIPKSSLKFIDSQTEKKNLSRSKYLVKLIEKEQKKVSSLIAKS